MLSPLNMRALEAYVRRPDRDAWKNVVQALADRAFLLALCTLQDAAQARAIAREALCALYREGIMPPARMPHALYVHVLRLCSALLRQRQKILAQDLAFQAMPDLNDDFIPLAFLSDPDALNALWAALQALPPAAAAAGVLAFGFGCRDEQIAQLLQCPPEAIAGQLNAVRHALRACTQTLRQQTGARLLQPVGAEAYFRRALQPMPGMAAFMQEVLAATSGSLRLSLWRLWLRMSAARDTSLGASTATGALGAVAGGMMGGFVLVVGMSLVVAIALGGFAVAMFGWPIDLVGGERPIGQPRASWLTYVAISRNWRPAPSPTPVRPTPVRTPVPTPSPRRTTIALPATPTPPAPRLDPPASREPAASQEPVRVVTPPAPTPSRTLTIPRPTIGFVVYSTPEPTYPPEIPRPPYPWETYGDNFSFFFMNVFYGPLSDRPVLYSNIFGGLDMLRYGMSDEGTAAALAILRGSANSATWNELYTFLGGGGDTLPYTPLIMEIAARIAAFNWDDVYSDPGIVTPMFVVVTPEEEGATLPGTDTSLPGTDTSLPGTDTSLPGTDTSLPGTDTSLPGTDTSLPGTDTSLPGTDTSLPGTDTSLPGTDTSLPGTDTSLPGTDTSLPGTP